jgi:Zn-dependent M32 family carboxypeptidase
LYSTPDKAYIQYTNTEDITKTRVWKVKAFNIIVELLQLLADTNKLTAEQLESFESAYDVTEDNFWCNQTVDNLYKFYTELKKSIMMS